MPRQVDVELQRVVERWRQLPLDHALSYADRVRALAQSLADEVAIANGLPPSVIPDCGPASLMDQLTVMVYDALTHDALTHDAPAHDAPAPHETASPAPATRTLALAKDLANLRHSLH